MQNLKSKIRRLVNLGKDLSNTNLFDQKAFQQRLQYKPCYDVVADSLCKNFDFQTMLDVGCANGFLLDSLHQRSKIVHGIELSDDALEFIPMHLRAQVTIADATKIDWHSTYDLVTCIEVAEHVEESQSESIVKFLAATSKQYVYFTAAYPDQPGHGHINCQPQFFWMKLFEQQGFEIDWSGTQAMIDALKGIRIAPWLSINSLVFSKKLCETG